ncbi:hypothetical protein IWW39_005963, partial [Coemansia spiralis]
HLSIELGEEDVYSGEALRILSQEPYAGCAFPLVRDISFAIMLGNGIQVEQSTATTNIGALAQRLKEMVPMAKACQLYVQADGVTDHGTNRHIKDLMTRLFQLAGEVGLSYSNSLFNLRDIQLDGVHNLVSIKSSDMECIGMLVRLARQNVPTLETLQLGFSFVQEFTGIIQETDGAYVEYPRLTTLYLYPFIDNFGMPPPVFKGAKPFPSLWYLRFTCAYPFGDDTLFRGNAATLEHLTARLSAPATTMLRKSRVFSPGSHPKLRYVRVYTDGGSVPRVFPTYVEELRFVLSIGARASVRIADIGVPGTELTRVVASLDNLASLQSLSQRETVLDLWDTITLIKSLPLLAHLHTAPPAIGALPKGVTLKGLPAYVVTKHAPLSKEFRHWSIQYPDDEGDYDDDDDDYGDAHYNDDGNGGLKKDSFICILLLALVCRNFVRATSCRAGDEGPLEMMDIVKASKMFKPYASQLQHFQLLEGNE